MQNKEKNTLKSEFIKRKKKKVREIYIQEFLRGYRSDLIIQALSEKFLIAPATLYEYIRPATLQKEIKAGKFHLKKNYVSIINL